MIGAEVIANLRSHHEADDVDCWVQTLPRTIDTLLTRWQMRSDGPPLTGGLRSLVVPLRDQAGRPRVMKLTIPGEELHREYAALRACDGRGIVRVVDADLIAGALLLERITPARDATALPWRTLLQVAAEPLRQLWSAPVPRAVPDVRTESERWIRDIHRRGGDHLGRASLQAIDDLHRELVTGPAPHVLVHGDAHPGNLLADRSGWCWVDPSPLAGDPAIDLEPALRVAWRQCGPAVLEDWCRAAGERDLPWERALGWAAVRWMHFGLWRADASGDDALLAMAFELLNALEGR